MKKLILFITVLWCFQTLTAQWELQYPEPTDKSLTDVYFADESNGWLVGAEGTIIHTSDGGLTWDFQNSGTAVQLRSVFFTDLLTGWIVGGETHPIPGHYIILHTTDGGNNWALQENDSVACLQSVYFANSMEGWAVGNRGTLLHTENSGIDWNSQWPGSQYLDFREVYFVNPEHGWIAADQGLFHTVDGGLNWNELMSGTFLSVFFINENEGWASTSGIGYGSAYIFHTSDAFITWDTINSSGNYDSSSGFHSIFFNDSNNGWTLHYMCNWGGWVSSCSNTLRKTENGGDTWEILNLPIHTGLNALSFTNDGYGCIVGSHGVILNTENWEDQWNLVCPGNNFGFNDIDFSDSMHGWAVGSASYYPNWASYGSAIVHTADGGAHWEIQNSTLTGPIQAVDFINNSTGWAVGNSITANAYDTAYLIHTTDGGQSWSVQKWTTDFAFHSVFFIDESTGWVAGGYYDNNGYSEGKILRTQDGGNIWEEQYCDTCKAFNTVFFVDENNGWAAGSSIYHTLDGGLNWIQQEFDNPGFNLESIHFNDVNNGWVVGNQWGGDGILLHTIDGGMNWEADYTNYPLHAVSFINQETGMISCSNGIILKTINGGISWEEKEPITENDLYDVCMTNEGHVFAGGEWGTIIHAENFLTHTSENFATDHVIADLTCYPNPTNGYMHLRMSIPTATGLNQQTIELEIFAISGMKVKELLYEEMSPGTHEMQVDLRDLPAGVYYCVLKTKDGIQTAKVIKR